MRIVLRALLLASFGVALVRAALFLGYAAVEVVNPLDVYHLEAQMVHLAWRARHARVLYPDWRGDPHVLNVFGPLYFLAVGRLGRWLDADLEGLYRIGRLVTVAAGLIAAGLVGLAAGRREGRRAGGVAALMALGAAPMVGFGAMVRADVAADLLGFAGFLLAAGRPARGRGVLGAALLVAAIYTKQTAGLYLIAAVLAAWLSGRRRRAAGLGLGAGAATLAIAGAATLMIEPHFARDLFGAAETPVDLPDWSRTLERLGRLGPELPLLAAAGIVLWTARPGRRDVPLAVLAAAQLVVPVLLAMKSGSDLNYFLGLRLAAALAAGAIWGAASRLAREPDRAGFGSKALAAVGLIGLGAALLPSLELAQGRYQSARAIRDYLRTSGRPGLLQYRRIFRLAEDPEVAILTDSGMVAARQGDRAAFVDPWLFRILVVTGKIDPRGIRRRLERGAYDYVITTKDLHDASDPYDSYGFGLPPELAEAARRHYEPVGVAGGLFLYAPRRDPTRPDPRG